MLHEELIRLGIDWVTNYYPYVNPVPYNVDKLEYFIIKHIRAGDRIAIFPDSDVDGMLSALEIKSMLEVLGCKDIYLIKIDKKMHGLTSIIVDDVVESGAKLLLTVDSSTNNYDAINKLSVFDVDHCIIDHHEITNDLNSYPNSVVVVNSRDTRNKGFNNVSAGMLCYIVIHDLLNKVKIDKQFKLSFLNKMYVLGYITLYTDCMDMNDEYNLSVVCNIELRKSFIPLVISQFMSEYDSLTRNFIEFKFGPRINSLIRRERFDIIYELLFKRQTEDSRNDLLSQTESIYKDNREAMNYISDILPVELNDFYVSANLDDIHMNEFTANIMKNYTGLVANNLMSRYKRMAIVISTDESDTFKGSVRDPYNRHSLEIFDRFCDCGGHMSAFGFKLQKRDINNFNRQIQLSSNELKINMAKSRIVMEEYDFDDRLPYQIRSIADYNEISGNSIPKAIIRYRVDNSSRIYNRDNYSKLNWEGIDIICFNRIYNGDTIMLTPTVTKNGVICYGTKDLDIYV